MISSENVTDASSDTPVHLTGLHCTGHETDLLACQHSLATDNCTHTLDVGVQCLPGAGETTVPRITWLSIACSFVACEDLRVVVAHALLLQIDYIMSLLNLLSNL